MKFTRRQALSMVMALYDPLGLVGPALVTGKLLLTPALLAQPGDELGPRLACAREAEVGKLVHSLAVFRGGHLPPDDAACGRSGRT